MKVVDTADGSSTAFSDTYGETFHSVNGAVTESRHVFLDATGVSARLQRGQTTRVLEIGLGLGLNALLTADLALGNAARLEYHALENDRRVCTWMQVMNYQQWLNEPSLAAALVNGLASSLKTGPSGGTDGGSAISLAQNIELTVHWVDATTADLPDLLFHAIYLDAFSPDANPACWTCEFFTTLYEKLATGGNLATYSAKGSVRRALLAAGFSVNKLAGPPGKREMLLARKQE